LGWRKGTAFCGIFPQRKKGKKLSRGCVYLPPGDPDAPYVHAGTIFSAGGHGYAKKAYRFASKKNW